MTTVTCDDTQHKTYTVTVGRFALHSSHDEPNFVDMRHSALICIGESYKKEEHVTNGPTIKYSQGIQNSCIISTLASALYYIGDELASKYIIRRKQKSLSFIYSKGRMQFCRDTFMGKQGGENKLKYIIIFRMEYIHDNI